MKKFNLKRFTFVILSCFALIFLILQSPSFTNAGNDPEFNRDLQNYNVKLRILDQNNKEISQFMVAIADNDNSRMYGLMNLDYLPQKHGMLFLFDHSQVITMWMKNTRIPLDMLFIDENNIITNIKTDAKPYSLDIISSEKEINRVLEINGGLVRKLNIKIGQTVKY